MHPYGVRYDSSWFFTCGKAWAEGLTPYVDFADSKGPLLWLIYGLGYLLSPTSYHGVFWLSVLAYAIAFAFIWRTSRLFVDKREALLVLCAMPLFLFFITYHNEVRAEDFCMPAICGGIYFTCSAMRPGGDKLSKDAFLLGICMAYCLLIKWNIFFMMGGMALLVAGVSLCRKSFSGIGYGLLGMAAFLVPFFVYFLWAGNLQAFIQEYFVNTLQITDRNLFRSFPRDKVVITAMLVSLVFFCRHFCVSYWFLLAFFPFICFLMLRSVFLHYFATAMPFTMFALIFVANKLSAIIAKLPRSFFGVLLIMVYCGALRFNFHPTYLPMSTHPMQIRKAVMDYMTKKERPKIMFTDGDGGQGLCARAIPACKYWAQQKDASQQMKAAREQAVRERKADFIVVTNLAETPIGFIPLMERSGYRQCVAPVFEDGRWTMTPLPLYEK